MLSLLKQTAVHILATGSDDGCEIEEWQDEAIVTLAVNDFRALVPAWSGISWPNLPSMVDVCTKTLVPVCRAVQQTLQDDIDQLAHILVELDPSALDDCEENSISETSAEESYHSLSCRDSYSHAGPSKQSLRIRRKSDPGLDGVLCITNIDPLIPTIVITPCPSQPRDLSCLVPFQDISYGKKLVVPTYPVVNDAFPPQLPKSLPFIERWRFKDGHWWAVLPSPEEQTVRGLFPRPISRRRRSCVDPWSRYFRSRRPSLTQTA